MLARGTGACHDVRVTTPPTPPPPYDPAGGSGYQPTPPRDHPQAITALVLGILGVVLCGVLAPFAWVIGGRAVAEIDASQGTIGGRGAASAGRILGIVGTILLALAALFVVLVIGLGAFTTVVSTQTVVH